MLKAREVWEEQEERRERRMMAMRPVMSQMYAQIRKQATHSPNAPYIVFEVPSYVFGYPLFNVIEARDYLMKVLADGGYMVWVVDDKYLLISWMMVNGKNASHRPPLLTNYRPQVYDPSTLGSMN